MTTCRHQQLVLVKSSGKKFRCRRCGLTIDEKELGNGFCPECLEVKGLRHRDFAEVEPEEEGGRQIYRCETCNALIEVD